MLRILTTSVVVLLTAGASATTVRLDVPASHATFTVDSTLHTVHGELPLTRGVIEWDAETGAARGEVVLDATRAATGNRQRDRKMRGEVLESERFGTVVFRPQRVSGAAAAAGDGEVILVGDLLLHGEHHAVSIPAEVRRDGDRLEAHGRLEIPYVEWGMADPSVLVLRVAKVVEVELDVVGVVEP